MKGRISRRGDRRRARAPLGGARDRSRERRGNCCSTASDAEGDLALDDAALGAMRDALARRPQPTDRDAGGPRLCRGVQPAAALLCHRRGAYRAAAGADAGAGRLPARSSSTRAESFATEARFPGVELSTEWPDEALERLKPDRRSAVVTLTHDPKLDDPALAVALRSECFYIGALGSQRTHAGALRAAEGDWASATPISPASTARSVSRSARCRRPRSRSRSLAR